MEELFTHPVDVRYMEVDQQGVVFNSWYLVYFDDAMTQFLAARGLPYESMIARGYDVQLVNNETTWRKGVRWRDDVRIAVSPSRIGTTSFVLDFAVRVGEEGRVTGRTVYVVIATDGSGKRAIPAFLRDALGTVVPLHPQG
ncbi:thioesterase family protein [soil metagenome]